MRSRLKRERERSSHAPKKRNSGGRLTIETIKERVHIEDVVEELGGRVPTLKTGWTRVSCPFHEDRTPSASIDPIEGRFFCFSCDTKGDVIDLAQKHLDLGPDHIKEAIEWLDQTF